MVVGKACFNSARLLLASAVCVWLTASLLAVDRTEKAWHSTPDLSMGSQDVDMNGRCLRMSASIVDSSLARLHKKKVASGTEFHRGRTVVDHFPDELMVEVTVTDCAAPYAVPVPKASLRTLQFTAAWRRGTDERAAAEIYVPRSREKETWSDANDTFQSYELTVQSTDTPLTDQLVLTVSSADGKKLAQFVAGL